MNSKCLGKKYGPFFYKAAFEKMREFSLAVKDDNSIFAERSLSASAPYEEAIAHPLFCACFNQKPLSVAVRDPELGIDLAKLLHGEQEFEFHKPVTDGMELLTEGEIAKIWRKDRYNFMQIESVTRDKCGDKVVTGRYTVLMVGW